MPSKTCSRWRACPRRRSTRVSASRGCSGACRARRDGAAPTRAGNLIWRFDDGRPRVLLLAHVDTVFARELPHEPVLEGARVRGPGVGDNAAAVVCARPGRRADGARARRRGAGGRVHGLRGRARQPRGRARRLRRAAAAAALALEGHGLLHVAVDAVGSLRARISVRRPRRSLLGQPRAPGAIDEVCRIARALSRPAAPRGEHEHRAHRGRHDRQRDRGARRARDRAARARRGRPHALLARAARAGGRASAQPSRSSCWGAGRPGASTGDSRCSRRRRVREQLGLPDELVAASTDANAALAAGIPALCLGCAQGRRNAHTRRVHRDRVARGRPRAAPRRAGPAALGESASMTPYRTHSIR